MTIPLVDLRAGFEEVRAEVLGSIEQALESGKLFLGPNTEALEKEFAAFIGGGVCIGVSNGTDALLLALKAAGVEPGDEVIMPSHTFFATAEAVVHAGAKPVFIDVNPVTYTVDAKAIEAAITDRTRAVIPVHLYGHPADMREIMTVAARRNVVVIEDASQAHGASIEGRMVGTFGLVNGFSCYFTKNLGAYGEAGLITTADAAVADLVRTLRNHGRSSKDRHEFAGYNHRIDELQSAVLRTKLKRLAADNGRRQAIAELYREGLASVGEVVLPTAAPWAQHVYHLFVIRSQSRDALAAFLNKRGIGTGIHYAIPVHLQPAMEYLGYKQGSLPVTEQACREILSLPIYPQLTGAQVETICEAVQEFVGSTPSVGARR